jgi:hypothetical protein
MHHTPLYICTKHNRIYSQQICIDQHKVYSWLMDSNSSQDYCMINIRYSFHPKVMNITRQRNRFTSKVLFIVMSTLNKHKYTTT